MFKEPSCKVGKVQKLSHRVMLVKGILLRYFGDENGIFGRIFFPHKLLSENLNLGECHYNQVSAFHFPVFESGNISAPFLHRVSTYSGLYKPPGLCLDSSHSLGRRVGRIHFILFLRMQKWLHPVFCHPWPFLFNPTNLSEWADR